MARPIIAPTDTHRLRFVKNKLLGMSTEQIAKEEGINEKYIKQSIAKVESYRALHTLDELEASQVEVILFNKDLQKIAIRNGLQATTQIILKEKDAEGNENEKIVEVKDVGMQLRTVEVIAKMTDNLMGSRARSLPQQTTNVNILNAGGGTGVGIATFEDRLREVKRKRGQLEQQALPAPRVDDSDIEEITPDWEGDVTEQQDSA